MRLRSTPGARGLVLATLGTLAALGCANVPPAPLDPQATADAFRARTLTGEDLHRFLDAALDDGVASWPPERWDARTLGAAALYFRPSLGLAAARARRAGAAIESASARPNPTLGLAPEWVSNAATGISPWIAAVHLDWPIETAGKRGHRIERAQALALASRYAWVGEAWSIQRAVGGALADAVASQKRVASLEAEARAAAGVVALVDARVRQGAASAAETAPLRLGWLDAERLLAAERSRTRELRARLAEAVGVPADALAGLALDPPDANDAGPFETLSVEDALQRALLERSDVLAGLAEYAATEAALRLELARQYPDLHVGNGFQFDQGQNKWAIGLTLDLPLLDQNQGPIAEAEAARGESAAAFLAIQARAIGEVEQAIARRDGFAQERRRLRALRAERDAQLERARSALALGATDRAAALAAEIESIRAVRALEDSEAAWLQALADLEAAMQPPAPWIAALERSRRTDEDPR